MIKWNYHTAPRQILTWTLQVILVLDIWGFVELYWWTKCNYHSGSGQTLMKMLLLILVKLCRQTQWCCSHPKDQTFVGFSVTWEFHLLRYYHHVQPATEANKYTLVNINKFPFCDRQGGKRASEPKVETNNQPCAYLYHNTLVEQPFGNKYPKNVIEECTSEKNCSHLIRSKKNKLISFTASSC